MKTRSQNKGFSLADVIITVAILVAVIGAALFSLSSFLSGNQQNEYGSQMVHALRRAQGNSMARYKNSSWGVYFNDPANTFTFFKGSTYTSREAGFDEVTAIPSSLDLRSLSFNGGGSEVVFAKVTGETAQYGSLSLRENSTGSTLVLSINAKGLIEKN